MAVAQERAGHHIGKNRHRAERLCDLEGARRLAPDTAAIEIGRKPDQPGRPPQDHRHQDQAVDRELDAAHRAAEPALQQRRGGFQQHSADHGAPQRADAADDRHQRGLDRDVEAERGRRIDEVDVLGVEGAGERGQERADHVDVPLDLRRVDADRLSRIFILTDRDEVVADPGFLDPVGDPQSDHEQAEHDVVIR
ncbi:hypothetical protein chiPu_0029231, partial [Chiloscyllium punctatum]|nr:hypothetical protein [Chiloscyllium punctatum]